MSLCAEYGEIEQRLLEIRLDVIKKFNRTAKKWGLTPVEIEDDEIIDDEAEFNETIHERSEPIQESNTECAVTYYQNEIMNENLSQIQIINSNGEMEDIVVEDYGDDAIHEDDCETMDDSENVKQEYFEEESGNMVEIVTENGKEIKD